MQVLGGQGGYFQKGLSYASETSDMNSEGLEEMFEGNFADKCWCYWGAERMVKLAQTRERGPLSAPEEISLYNHFSDCGDLNAPGQNCQPQVNYLVLLDLHS